LKGYASKEWLGLLLTHQDRFLLRWPSAYHLLDVQAKRKEPAAFPWAAGPLLPNRCGIWLENAR